MVLAPQYVKRSILSCNTQRALKYNYSKQQSLLVVRSEVLNTACLHSKNWGRHERALAKEKVHAKSKLSMSSILKSTTIAVSINYILIDICGFQIFFLVAHSANTITKNIFGSDKISFQKFW
jgi:hypothetical protein